MRRCVPHAQEYVKEFYAAHGYQEYGDIFLEVHIPHVKMRKELESPPLTLPPRGGEKNPFPLDGGRLGWG
jgi:hypothetical protein